MIHRELAQLLLSLFSNHELESFLSYYEVEGRPARELMGELPPPGQTPPRQFTEHAARVLLRERLLSRAFTNALLQERPGRSAEIQVLADRLDWGPPRPLRAGGDTANPFADPGLFEGRQSELQRVARFLREGRSVLLIGGRRAGKTSLTMQLDESLIGRPLYRADVSRWEPRSTAELIEHIGSLFGKVCYAPEHLEQVLLSHAPLTIILDEAERLLGRPWTGGFFAWLRSLDDMPGMGNLLSLVLVGGPELYRYRDPDNMGSPVLNTSETVFLEPLSVDARRKLIGRLDTALDEETLFEAVGGHPWLMARALERVWMGAHLPEALNHVGKNYQKHFRTWHRQVGERSMALLRQIPPDGLPDSAFDVYPRGPMRQWVEEWNTLQCVGLVDRRDGRTFRGPELVLDLLEES